MSEDDYTECVNCKKWVVMQEGTEHRQYGDFDYEECPNCGVILYETS